MKRMLVILCVLLSILSIAASGVITVSNNAVKITMVNQEPMPAAPGEWVKVRFRVENIGTKGAHNVQVKIDPKYPFSLDPSEDGTINVSSIDGWQVDEEGIMLDWRLRVDEDAVEGEEKIKVFYKVDQSPWIGQEFEIEIRTIDAFLSIKEITTNPSKVEPGEFSDLNLQIKNLADSRLTNLKFTLDLSNVEISPIGSNEETVLSMKAKEEKIVTFRIVPSADAPSQVYKVPLSITYFDEVGTNYSSEQLIGIRVYGQPKYFLSIDSSDVFMGSSKGEFVLGISNIAPVDMRFVSVELVENENYTVISSPKVYIGNIDSDDTETVDFDIKLNGVKGKSVPLDLIIEHRDAYNMPFVDKEKVDLRIYSSREAAVYGLVQSGSPVGSVLSLSVLVLVGLFWYYNFRDCRKNKKKGFERKMWLIAIIGGTIFGAIIYYFVGRKKQQ